jgi:hypothetical protein
MVESTGKVPLEIMLLRTFHNAPPPPPLTSPAAVSSSKPSPTEKNVSVDFDVTTNDDDIDYESRDNVDDSAATQQSIELAELEHSSPDAATVIHEHTLDVPEIVDRRRSSVPAVKSSMSSSSAFEYPRFSESSSLGRMVATASINAINSTISGSASTAATKTAAAAAGAVGDKSPTCGSNSNDRVPGSSRSSAAASPPASPVWTVTADVPSSRHHQHSVRRHHQLPHRHQQQQQQPQSYAPTADSRSRSVTTPFGTSSTPSALMPDSGYCLQPSPLLAAPVPLYTGGAAGFSCMQPSPVPTHFVTSPIWPSIDHRVASPSFHRTSPSPSSVSPSSAVAAAAQQSFYSPFSVVSPVAFVQHHHDPSAAVAAFNYVQPSAAMLSQLPYHHQQQLRPQHHNAATGLLGMPPYHPGLASSTSVLTGLGIQCPTPVHAAAVVNVGGGELDNPYAPGGAVIVGAVERQSPEELLREITRLRNSLQTLETANASLTVKLGEQQMRQDTEQHHHQQQQQRPAMASTTTATDSGGSDRDDATCDSSDCSSGSDDVTSFPPQAIDKESVI